MQRITKSPAILLAAALALASIVSAAQISGDGWKIERLEKCSSCERKKCPSLGSCPLGFQADRCNCCQVCGLEEYQLCNLAEDWTPLASGEMSGRWHGRCGEGLECRVRKDVDPKLLREKQAICYCKKPGVVCASDGNTYSHCRMNALSRASNGNISMVSEGPCKSEPKILSITKAQEYHEGGRLTLMCEVQGFPMPTVSWYFRRSGRNPGEVKLPGNAEEISVSLRGGPQVTRLTSHLQISKVGLEHEGHYYCMAENDLGMQQDEVSLTVIPDGAQRNDWRRSAENSATWFGHDEWGTGDEM